MSGLVRTTRVTECIRSCVFAVWRFAEVVIGQRRNDYGLDMSWVLPQGTLLSLCEVYIATMVASIPFFWPILTKQINEIFVKYEFNVSSESRYIQHDDEDVELAPTKKRGGAVTVDEVDEPPRAKQLAHYNDDFVQKTLDPLNDEFRTRAAVETRPSSARPSFKHKRSLSRVRDRTRPVDGRSFIE